MSANSESSPRRMLENFANFILTTDATMEQICMSLSQRRSTLPLRLSIPGTTKKAIYILLPNCIPYSSDDAGREFIEYICRKCMSVSHKHSHSFHISTTPMRPKISTCVPCCIKPASVGSPTMTPCHHFVVYTRVCICAPTRLHELANASAPS